MRGDYSGSRHADPTGQGKLPSVTSHGENEIFIFEESRTLLANQLAQGGFFKITQKQQSFRKEPLHLKKV
ncbi:hypothetical protein ACTWQL_16375 [Pseudalkalibacillus sp. R45]|uniref:hypothetical protein n=1 Tax=Pseudalkalibacillus sp. R45 TaxID=3457433 RepID=UPI003FCE47E3